jgi:hypothetical protein
MDQGQIVERGTHADLLQAGGLYQELYLTQYARTATDPAEADAEIEVGAPAPAQAGAAGAAGDPAVATPAVE